MMRRRLLFGALLLLAYGIPTWAASDGCGAEGFTVRSARVRGPFLNLPWVRERFADATRKVEALEGQPYRKAVIEETEDALEAVTFLPEAADGSRRFSAVKTVEQCGDGVVDVVFSVFTSEIHLSRAATFESEKASPEQSAGADARPGRLRIRPSAGYGDAEQLFGGASLEYRPEEGFPLLDALTVKGRVSEAMHDFAVHLAGSRDFADGTIRLASWQLDYRNAREPAELAELRRNRLAANFSALTRPVGRLQLPVRFGGTLEAGTLESDAAAVDPGTIADSDYTGAKLYAGTTARLNRHSFLASYGLELGASGFESRVDWVKHIVDLGHMASVRVADHRFLDVESRVTAGLLRARGAVPVPVQFFGGNGEEPFVADESWTIRSNPVIRSLPANELHVPMTGTGRSHFVAANVTAALPVWHRPLVATELAEEFRPLLMGQFNGALNMLETTNHARNDHFKRLIVRLADVLEALEKLTSAVAAAEEAHPGEHEDLFEECTTNANTAARRARAAIEADNPETKYSNVAVLLQVDEDLLATIHSACIEQLNAQLNDPAIAAPGAKLHEVHLDMENVFAAGRAEARREAEAELMPAKRTLDSLLTELNVFSVSPVLGFDVARVGPAPSRVGLRYGLGGGARVTLVNSVDFTAGYFANLRRLAGEPHGAFFFELRFRDILQ